MKILSTLLIALTLMAIRTVDNPDKFHDFEMRDIRGRAVELSTFSGNVVVVVNTASKCGFTPQYAELQKVYDQYKDRGLVILGFPANEFGGQEPGTDEDIAEFCEVNYGVTFPMFSKTVVRGDGIHPLFKYLTTAENQDFTGNINWNFEKFVIDKEGNLVRRFRSRTNPTDAEFLQAIETLLKK